LSKLFEGYIQHTTEDSDALGYWSNCKLNLSSTRQTIGKQSQKTDAILILVDASESPMQ